MGLRIFGLLKFGLLLNKGTSRLHDYARSRSSTWFERIGDPVHPRLEDGRLAVCGSSGSLVRSHRGDTGEVSLSAFAPGRTDFAGKA